MPNVLCTIGMRPFVSAPFSEFDNCVQMKALSGSLKMYRSKMMEVINNP